jgi:uncharacterized protein YdaU (DUF1376 family)
MQSKQAAVPGDTPVNYYAFHIGDYAVDTRHLSLMQDLAYRRLLDLYYTDEQPITGEPAEVAADIGMGEYVEDVSKVLNKFFSREGDAWFSTRCEEEIAKFQAIVDRARTNGKAGGRPIASSPHPADNPPGTQPVPAANQKKPRSQAPNPNPNTLPTVKKSAFAPESVELPDCVPRQAWEEWVAYRKTRRISTTEPTVKLQLRKLSEWHATGHDPVDILETSISNGWQGLFEPKVRPQARADRRAETLSGLTNTGDHDARPAGDFIDVDARQI